MNKTLMTLVASLSYLTMTATNLEVINLSSEEASFELSKIQYIDFRGTEGFKIVGKDGSTLNETTYDQTRRIDFKGTLSKASSPTADNIQVYPNSNQDLLIVSGAESGCNIQFFDLHGKNVYSVQASGGDVEIPVANLIDGTYLLKAGNKVVKFIKK